MDVIDDMLAQMVFLQIEIVPTVFFFPFHNLNSSFTSQFKNDPSFKPQGGRLGENDMDYDTDEKSMATLRRHLRGAREEYYRYKR